MIASRSFRLSIAAIASLGALGVPGTAHAQSCSADTDCVKGFTCQTIGGAVCPPVAACLPGDDACAAPVCTPQTLKECEPGPCTTDADCAAGMECYADSVQDCPSVPVTACARGDECAPAPAVDAGACTTTTTRSCIPKYDLPCQVDSDCGDSFTCVPDTSTECSGGGPIDGGAVTSSCTTTTLSTSSCQADTITCATAADCPSTWACEATNSESFACAEPATSIDAGTPAACEGGTIAGRMLCTPPYTDLGEGFGAAVAVSNAANADAGGGAEAPTASGTNGNGSTGPAASGSGGGGCQMAPAGAGAGGAWLFAWLGLAGLARRRGRSNA